MSEMIDRVAEAIALAGNGGTWDDWYNEDQKEFHRKRARAAIEAMREPTDAMTEFGDAVRGNHADYAGGNGTANIFRSMIDEILK